MNRSSFMDVRDNGVSEAASKLVHREVAATMVNHGKGKIGAVYGPIPTLYFNGHHPFLRRFVGDIVKQLFPNPLVQTDAPACVDIALRTTPQGQLSVHAQSVQRSCFQEEAILRVCPAIGPITVRIRWTQNRLQLLWNLAELDWSGHKVGVGASRKGSEPAHSWRCSDRE